MSTVDPDVLQAQYFIAELERAADVLVEQIGVLERRMSGHREAGHRRRELHDVRRQVDAIKRRFKDQI